MSTAARKSADQWFAECAEGHRHPLNRRIHWICLPLLFGCVLGFIWAIPVPETWQEAVPWFNWALVAMVPALFFYVRLSPALSAGMAFFMSLCYSVLVLLELFAPWSVGRICVVVFMLAWTGQLIGRILERRPPSFSRDALSLLIGPAWLMSCVYRRLGQKY